MNTVNTTPRPELVRAIRLHLIATRGECATPPDAPSEQELYARQLKGHVHPHLQQPDFDAQSYYPRLDNRGVTLGTADEVAATRGDRLAVWALLAFCALVVLSEIGWLAWMVSWIF
jgi:hypothetical protein